MIKTREEKKLEKAYKVLDELEKIYNPDSLAIEGYKDIFNAYKRLYSRYTKVVKLGDSVENDIMREKNKLNHSLKYTIKKARSKLIDNVTEHRKTKMVTSRLHVIAKDLENALNESYSINVRLQKQLALYEKHYGVLQNSFTEELHEPKSKDVYINPSEFKDKTINDLIHSEMQEENNSFILAKISLDNFSDMIDTIEESSSVHNFLLGTYKYLKNSFYGTDVVFNYHFEIFYVICKKKTIGEVLGVLELLNKRKTVLNFDISFTTGLTQYIIDKDSIDDLMQRADTAFTEALNSKNSNFCIK